MDVDWTEVFQTGLWVIGALVVIFCFTNGFGLLGRTYKGTWVRVRIEAMPTLMTNLKELNGFLDSDGMYGSLEITVQLESSGQTYVPVYKVKIPEFIFHKVKHDIILKELGIK